MHPYLVHPDQNGMRLDRFLAEVGELSRKRAKQLIDEGRVFIGSRRIVIGSWEVRTGDRISLRDPDAAPLPRAHRRLKIVFEDDAVLVVEKPAGVPCERSAQTLSSTLVEDLRHYLARTRPGGKPQRLGLLHRLDTETSGLMVYSLSPKADEPMLEQFRRHSIERRYLALVEGRIEPAEGTIQWPVMRDPASGGRRMMAVRDPSSGRGSRAVTHYRVVKRQGATTLVEATLETGRTHQVRVHFAALGHPVVGDKTYGSRIRAPRQSLHAWVLGFDHPVCGRRMRFESMLAGWANLGDRKA